MLAQRFSDNDQSKRDIPSFIEPMPPLISNPFMRPRPQKGTNLLELFEEDSESEEPELVQVYLRLKPYHSPSNLYEIRSDRCLITSVDTATAGHGRRTQHNVSKMYTFSHIFGPEATQKEVFENVVKDNLKKLPEGHNFTLLTYGASGSGKTYTLMGTVASPGLVPRSLEYVFRVVDAAQQPLYKPADGGSEKLCIAEQDYELQWVKRLRHVSAPLRDKYRRMSAGLCSDFTMSTMDLSNRTRHYVWVSFVEIYNEGIYDLLASSDRRNSSKLRIREDASGNVYVKGITQAFVRTGEEAYDVMVAGKHNLQVAATGVHAQSSRSHCIFTITMLTETEAGVRTSCVRLCDLAGCERARRTRNTGARMAESRAINSSLHVLERCLHTLRRRQRRAPAACVPYRESKLTRLLGAGLSGARGEAVSMVVTLNPAPEYAHETKHVLQLAAVARDIQVNNTIAESTLESSSQYDTTIGSSAEVVKLRSDNERLHFELVQAQSRNKELLAAMEERQQEAAATMRELVEEAKDMTRQYYEAQLEAARAEMEEMIEEYESRLSKTAKPKSESETPSKSLQNKVAQLMTEVAILEEKLTAERLARARAEEEVQHLRACIEERDEKAFEENASGNREDVMLLSDSDHESDEEVDDPCNESLEPTFKKEDINRSRLLLQNTFDQNSIHSENSFNNSARSNRTVENEDSVINKSSGTLKEHDSTHESTKESVYATGEDDSGSTNKTNDNMHDSGSNDTRNVSDMKLPVTQNEKHRNVSEYNQTYDNRESLAKAPEEPAHKETTVNSNKSNEYELLKPKETVPRGTYFVRCSADVDESMENLSINEPNSLTRGTYFVKEADRFVIPATDTIDEGIAEDPSMDSPVDDLRKPPSKVSETLVTKIIKSIKSSQGSNTSLAQFEQLEKASKNCDVAKIDTNLVGSVNKPKEKKRYFDENSPKIDEENLIPVPKLLKEKKTYFDNIDVNIEPPNDNAGEINHEVDNLQFDVTRSPSIVKDEGTNDFKPSAIKKLLGESFTRQPEIISSVQKVKVLHKKHESVDLFEGLDSPRPIAKTPEKVDVVAQAKKSIDQLVQDQKSASKITANIKRDIKIERESIAEESTEIVSAPVEINPVEIDMAENYAKEKSPLKTSATVSKTSENIVELATSTVKAPKSTKKIAEAAPERKELKKEVPNESMKVNNTIEEFDNLYKDISASRATEFELLVSQVNTSSKEEKVEHTETAEEIKYNLRHKSTKSEGVKFSDKIHKGDEEVLLESHAKCESKAKTTKRSLRLRRRKNQSDEEQMDQENKLKDIVNLQKEFSDVTMDVPAPLKVVKDIQSPEKPAGEDENVPPLMGIQSCPSKSVTRSRRKLFTPRAEPLDESMGQPGDSSERVYVPRPSYHRARARRKL
ncbi:kinesin-like protein KIF20B [Ostrinia furnacalis]|uniref:kinesin-like protein KIF20B n=1 Tax=Ostrinia furnacalis TaxID=93504 RepID=UPI00103DFF02|nr:kinesin-like protein KIF20B [Ostrinia furnacalis]